MLTATATATATAGCGGGVLEGGRVADGTERISEESVGEARTSPRASTSSASQDLSVIAPLRVQEFGDLDEIMARRALRVLVTYSKTFYFLDGPVQRGASYEAANLFVDRLNKRHDIDGRPIKAVFLPTPPDQLMSALADGYGDVAAAGLTVTAARSEQVGFSEPFATDVVELLVTGPAAPEVRTLRDLAGQTVWVRFSSSYAESLRELSADLTSRGLEPITIEPANEVLADEDLLEMADAGLLPMVVVDGYKAQLWNQVFDNVEFREDLPIATGRELAWALRKGTPDLASEVAEFVRSHRQGTLMGNILINRYFRDNEWVGNNLDSASQSRLLPLVEVFEPTPISTTSTGCFWRPRATRSPGSINRSVPARVLSVSCSCCR